MPGDIADGDGARGPTVDHGVADQRLLDPEAADVGVAGYGLADHGLAARAVTDRRVAEQDVLDGPGADRDLAEPGVFTDFVATRGPGLVRLARGLLKDPFQAEDVVQDVLAKVLVQWRRVRAADDVDAYVRRMVVNACTSWFRRAVRRERSHDVSTLPERPVADPSGVVAERDRVVHLLRRLPARQRAVLVLRHYEGMADAEIARLLGTSEVTVRSNVHRGLNSLRQMMAADDAAEQVRGR